MNLSLHLSVCGAIVVAIVAVTLYRKWLEDHSDHYIHLHNNVSDSHIVTNQTSYAKRVEILDKTTRILVALLIVYALSIAAFAVYNGWNAPMS